MANASAGNRARVTSMATMYSTTRPLMLMHRCLVEAALFGCSPKWTHRVQHEADAPLARGRGDE